MSDTNDEVKTCAVAPQGQGIIGQLQNGRRLENVEEAEFTTGCVLCTPFIIFLCKGKEKGHTLWRK